MNQIDKPNPFYPKAKVIAHSVSAVSGIEMITYEVEFWRGVLAELNTHNALSKNTSSSRAIPVKDMLAQVRDNPAGPVRFGKANKGMQDAGEHDALVHVNDGSWRVELAPEQAWMNAIYEVSERAEEFHDAGYAKQICNRLVEAGQWTKMVLSGTDWNNFMWLRKHGAADPSIDALARVIEEARANSTPTVLQPGEWHVPYYNDGVWKFNNTVCLTPGGRVAVDKFGHSLEHALMISSSCCAQASYRQLDDTVEKARRVSANLNLRGEQPDEPVHASPTEHQATPIQPFTVDYTGRSKTVNGLYSETWQEGITHVRRDGVFCSGNLRGWIQHRQLIPGNVKEG